MSSIKILIEDITPDYLNTVLPPQILSGSKVKSVHSQLIGTGKMGDNYRIALTYNSDCEAPETLVAKLPAVDQTAREMAGMVGAYRMETRFYQDLAEHAGCSVAKTYFADLNESGTEFILLMEDLAPAEPGDQLIGETVERAELALAEAAKLHTAFLNRDDLLNKDFIMHTDQESAEFGQHLLLENWPGFKQRFGEHITEECLSFGDKFLPKYAEWASKKRGEKTLIHADFRSENILFNDATGKTTAVDWQSIATSNGFADVAYFLGGSLTKERRRENEQSLIKLYQQKVGELGMTISDQQCQDWYCAYAPHSLLITVLGAMFSGADERGDKMFAIMAQRHLQQCVDLQSDQFI